MLEKILHAILLHNGVPKPDRSDIDSLRGGEFVKQYFLADDVLQRTSIIVMNGKIFDDDILSFHKFVFCFHSIR